ncbi:MAG: FAD-dependent oxidoreductase [Coriobacteriales bacterium]|jgi:ribulose 1,5-bisphosphate synthetase/thiazole synthase
MNVTTDYNVDVLVCGGGVAGVSAAIAAARQGARVLLLEKRESLGGICTNGYITGIAGHVDGICREWVERLAAQGDAVLKPHLPAVEPEKAKVMFEHMLIQSGVRFIYGAHVAEAGVEDGRIEDVAVYTLNGMMDIRAKFVIDCTGDATVASAAGAPCEVGGAEFMGLNESSSLGFRLGYVDMKQYKEAEKLYFEKTRDQDPEKRPLFLQYLQMKAIEDGFLPEMLSPGNLIYPIVGSFDESCMDVCLDATHSYYCHNTSPEDLTRQIVDQHNKVILFTEFLRKYVPGFGNCKLEHMGDQIGTREGRRVVGEYVLTSEDICSARKFDDGVVIFPEVLDSHHPTCNTETAMRHIHLDHEPENAICRPSQDDDNLKMHPFAPMGGYEVRQNPRCFCEIPLRSLIARDVDNLFVAGRCLSADWHAVGAVRVVATSMTMGQAAGNAAALCLKEGIPFARDVDGRAVREMQKEQGVPLDKPLEGYWARNRDMKGKVIIGGDMAMIMGEDGTMSFQA